VEEVNVMVDKRARENACCFTGHRPIKLRFGYDEEHPDCIKLKQMLGDEINNMRNKGVATFLSGMAMGVDIWCAEIALNLKKTYPAEKIRLVAVIPYEGQANRWSVEYRERYYNILEKADEVVTLQTQYIKGCMQARNRFMVDSSSHVIAVFNGGSGGTKSTIEYAIKRRSDVVVINPDTLKIERTPPKVIELFR
jgi:uncharacterized phage-like protein YoqJ